jgi:hypothetical protein
MAQILEELCETANFQPGDRVKTLRGSMRGTIVRLLPDGRVVWRGFRRGTDRAAGELAKAKGIMRKPKQISKSEIPSFFRAASKGDVAKLYALLKAGIKSTKGTKLAAQGVITTGNRARRFDSYTLAGCSRGDRT